MALCDDWNVPGIRVGLLSVGMGAIKGFTIHNKH